MLLSNSLFSMGSLHAQILASEGTNTSFEVTAFSESMTIGNWESSRSLANEANNSRSWIGAGATKFLTAVDELDFLLFDYRHDAGRVFRDGVDLLNFRIFCCHVDDESIKTLIGHVGLVRGSKVCLPTIARRLPTDVWHVYFYFL